MCYYDLATQHWLLSAFMRIISHRSPVCAIVYSLHYAVALDQSSFGEDWRSERSSYNVDADLSNCCLERCSQLTIVSTTWLYTSMRHFFTAPEDDVTSSVNTSSPSKLLCRLWRFRRRDSDWATFWYLPRVFRDIFQHFFYPAQWPTFYLAVPAHQALPECPYGQSATVSVRFM